MGLFGGIFKAVKKVAGGALRVAASKLTGGVSDVVLSKLKSAGKARAQPAAVAPTEQKAALVNKVLQGVGGPRVSVATVNRVHDRAIGYTGSGTERPTPKRMPGRRKIGRRQMLPAPAKPAARAAPAARGLSPAMRAQVAKTQQLAAQWRAAGGKEGTGQDFFSWKRGK